MVGSWNTVYSRKEATKIKRNDLLTTLSVLKKKWRVSLEFKAGTFGASGVKQVFHMTIGGMGIGNGAKYGDRTPAVWTHPTKGILISSAVNNKVSNSKNKNRNNTIS